MNRETTDAFVVVGAWVCAVAAGAYAVTYFARLGLDALSKALM